VKHIEIENQKCYNQFIAGKKQAGFLQSWEWGEFQAAVGNRVVRLGFEGDDGSLFFAVSLIKKDLPVGKSYLYAPRLDFGNLTEEQLKFVFNSIREIAKKEKAIFLRFEPQKELQIANPRLQISKTIDVQPSRTVILDLSKTEEELLKNMHAKTRYNIRLAEKKGVVIREGGEGDFEKFWAIMEDTKERDGFRVHGKGYYKMMLKCQMPNAKCQKKSKFQNSKSEKCPISNIQSRIGSEASTGLFGHSISSGRLYIKLFLSEYQNKIIAGNIVSFFGDMATYVHGASANEFRNVMAPYLLQWRTIEAAKRMGYKYYDFNGIDEVKWPGVTRFKKGFGGEDVSYPGTFDLVFEGMWYNVYKMARRVRRL
jgi:peptidoglycan pentaglycine glycine transferase (the first glycine)